MCERALAPQRRESLWNRVPPHLAGEIQKCKYGAWKQNHDAFWAVIIWEWGERDTTNDLKHVGRTEQAKMSSANEWMRFWEGVCSYQGKCMFACINAAARKSEPGTSRLRARGLIHWATTAPYCHVFIFVFVYIIYIYLFIDISIYLLVYLYLSINFMHVFIYACIYQCI